MGAVISRWRSKPSTVETLEKLNKDIESMEKLKQSNLQCQKQMVGSLVLYSVLLYIVGALLFYFYYLPEQLVDRVIYSTPLLIFPVLVVLLKQFLHWYFVKRINRNESHLEELRERKKSILEEVMEKETYKKAKEILEKFDPERFANVESDKGTPAPQRSPDGQELRNRSAAGMRGQPLTGCTPAPGSVPPPGATPQLPPGQGRGASVSGQRNGQQPRLMPVPMPRPILPRERTAADRIIEYLVGDGPSNRYALICRQCLSHNGMALKEEFEYTAFRCCYCYVLNPARKERPFAPQIDTPVISSRRRLAHQMAANTEPEEPFKEGEEDEETREEEMETEDSPANSTEHVAACESGSGSEVTKSEVKVEKTLESKKSN